jgi:hypothetical protein
LLTVVFVPRPALQALASKTIHVPVVVNGGQTVPVVLALPNGPPGVLVLRI